MDSNIQWPIKKMTPNFCFLLYLQSLINNFPLGAFCLSKQNPSAWLYAMFMAGFFLSKKTLDKMLLPIISPDTQYIMSNSKYLSSEYAIIPPGNNKNIFNI